MDRREKKKFVRSLSQSVTSMILKYIDAGKVPEEWDGVELRQLMADKFDQCVFKGSLTGRRLKEYKNATIVNGL